MKTRNHGREKFKRMLNKLRGVLNSWVGITKFQKCKFSQVICRFNIILNKILENFFFCRNLQADSKIHMEKMQNI